jgi:hypothetical protein
MAITPEDDIAVATITRVQIEFIVFIIIPPKPEDKSSKDGRKYHQPIPHRPKFNVSKNVVL